MQTTIQTAENTEGIRRIENWLHSERQRCTIHVNADLMEAVEEHGGGQFEYAYDRYGDLTRIIEANGATTDYEYDDRRRLSRALHADGSTTIYKYGANDRLIQIDDRGIVSRFEHDSVGRVAAIYQGRSGASVYRYDEQDRVVEARTSLISTHYEYDDAGRQTAISQAINGVTISVRLEYDVAGRLARMLLPGTTVIDYQWNSQTRPQAVSLNDQAVAKFDYVDASKTTRICFANGVVEEARADPIDSRPVLHRILTGSETLFWRENLYGDTGRLVADGVRRYDYDALGRLVCADDFDGDSEWHYSYDSLDNQTDAQDSSGEYRLIYDTNNRLTHSHQLESGKCVKIDCDPFGRPLHKTTDSGQWSYRYNDAGQLLHALYRGDTIAQFTYDHKGRLALAKFDGHTERYLYGPTDELLAITDEHGNPLRLFVRTPLGLLAEIRAHAVYFRHHDDRGTCYLITDQAGDVVARFQYTPFGAPLHTSEDFCPIFAGRLWNPAIQMYNFGARWYDPSLNRFLTPDTYSGAPDDPRIVNPFGPASKQWQRRAVILTDWLKQPRVRNRYAFCGNDPLNRTDPNGHWSFGGVLLTVLGAIWTLPNTLFGLLLEITCLVGEVVRWLTWLVSFGNIDWEPPGFDVASSSYLNAFALVFKGGWLGSFSSMKSITFGNVFFVYGKLDQNPYYSATGDEHPPAYDGKVAIPRKQSPYEHELRHTNQYGWFGPFFHLGLPVFGVYLWDVILNGYENAWLERDARNHSETSVISEVAHGDTRQR